MLGDCHVGRGRGTPTPCRGGRGCARSTIGRAAGQLQGCFVVCSGISGRPTLDLHLRAGSVPAVHDCIASGADREGGARCAPKCRCDMSGLCLGCLCGGEGASSPDKQLPGLTGEVGVARCRAACRPHNCCPRGLLVLSRSQWR